MNRIVLLSAAGLACLLSGCASQEGFPSLAPRAIERELGDLPPAGPCPGDPTSSACDSGGTAAPAEPAPVADDIALRTRVTALVEEARAGASAFDTLIAGAKASAERAGPEGSETWIDAQTSLSALESARAPTVEALSALDRLTLERAGIATSEGDFAMLAEGQADAQQLADAQQAEINAIRERLSGR